jgi:hypothetical protein
MDDREAAKRLKRISELMRDREAMSNADRLVEIAKVAVGDGTLVVGGERMETTGRNRKERGGSTRGTR